MTIEKAKKSRELVIHSPFIPSKQINSLYEKKLLFIMKRGFSLVRMIFLSVLIYLGKS